MVSVCIGHAEPQILLSFFVKVFPSVTFTDWQLYFHDSSTSSRLPESVSQKKKNPDLPSFAQHNKSSKFVFMVIKTYTRRNMRSIQIELVLLKKVESCHCFWSISEILVSSESIISGISCGTSLWISVSAKCQVMFTVARHWDQRWLWLQCGG